MTAAVRANTTLGAAGSSLPRLPTIKTFAIVFLIALTVRAGWGLFRLAGADHPNALEFPDERQYWLMAGSLHGGEGLIDEFGFRATRMPLYPAALSVVAGMENGVVVAKAAQWIVGSLAAVLTAGLAATMIGPRVGTLAGLLVAVDPFLVFFSSLLLTETIFIVTALALWWITWPLVKLGPQAGSPWRWSAVGLAAGLTVYARESGLGLVVACLCLVVLVKRFDRRTVGGAVLAAGIVVLMLIPWAARNHRVTGDWNWLTHRGGVSLYDGVGPQADGSSDLADVQQMPAVLGLNEVEWNRYFLRESMREIRRDPWRILRLAGVKFIRTWNPVPNAETYQSRLETVVSAAWTLPMYALALAGAILLPRIEPRGGVRAVIFLLLPAAYVSAMHSLFVGSVRYRLAAMPMIEILAAVGVIALAGRVLKGKRATRPGGDN